MNLLVQKKFILITLMANSCWAGIEVPRNECVWLNGHYGSEIKCEPVSSEQNEYDMDDYVIKNEYVEDIHEMLFPIEIKNELVGPFFC